MQLGNTIGGLLIPAILVRELTATAPSFWTVFVKSAYGAKRAPIQFLFEVNLVACGKFHIVCDWPVSIML